MRQMFPRKAGADPEMWKGGLVLESVPRPSFSIIEPPLDGSLLRNAALAYTQAGLPVFPLQGKRPLVPHGLHKASTDPATVERWWQRWPQANIGIPTGKPSGWIALDIDPRHGGLDSLVHLQRAMHHRAADLACTPISLLATRIQRTGGNGLHCLFGWRQERAWALRNTVEFAGYAGLDLRGDGGYIVVAPSWHASGGSYTWLNAGPLQPFPDLLIDLLQARRRALAQARLLFPLPQERQMGTHHRDPASWLAFVLQRVSIGNRHAHALFLACRLLQDAGLSPSQAEPWMRDYARHVPQGNGEDCYSVDDALACLAWAASHVR